MIKDFKIDSIDNVFVPLVEVEKDLLVEAPSGFTYYVYNPLTKEYKKEITGKNDIAHNKYAYSELKYYIINEEMMDYYE